MATVPNDSGDRAQLRKRMGGAATAHGAQTRLEEPDFSSSRWYFTKDEIERFSPSRKDGIDPKKEAQYRRSYCAYLQELGVKLKMPQITIATAIVFCHRFFMRQSHAKNDRFMVATISLFLSGKVEETPRSVNDVVCAGYMLRHRRKIFKDLCDQQIRLLLTGEKLLLATLGFDLNVSHPYRPMVLAVKKLDSSVQSSIAQVAWNFINDGLKSTLFLQFKPHHIAAGAIFLAGKFLRMKLPSDGEKAWWHAFGVTSRKLEEVSSQMLEQYENPGSYPLRSVRPTSASIDTPPSAQVSTQTEAHDVTHEDLSKKASSSPGEVVSGKGPDVVEPVVVDKKEEVELIDEAKLKAALEKRRKSRVEATAAPLRKAVVTDEELLERELENGIEVGRPKVMESKDRNRKQGPSLKRQRLDEVKDGRDEVHKHADVLVEKREHRDEVGTKNDNIGKTEEPEVVLPADVAKREDEVATKEHSDEALGKTKKEVEVKKECSGEAAEEFIADEREAKKARLDSNGDVAKRKQDGILKKECSVQEVVKHSDIDATTNSAEELAKNDANKEQLDEVVANKNKSENWMAVKSERPDEVTEALETEVVAAKRNEKRERPDEIVPKPGDEEEPGSKKKKLNEEVPSKQEKEPAQDEQQAKMDATDEEEGELPSSGHDFPPRSPPRPVSRERRMLPPHERQRPMPPFVSYDNRYDRRRDYHPCPRREPFFERPQPNGGVRQHRDYYAPHHHHFQQQQQQQQYYHQQQREMEWHHHRFLPPPLPQPAREAWMERDSKRARYDSYK